MNSKIFVGNIMRCIKYRRKTHFSLEGFGTVDNLGCIELESELYKEYAILLQVSDDSYVDFCSFKSFDDWRKVVKCVSSNIPLPEVILKTYETYEGCLYVDSDSLRCFDEIESIPGNVLDKNLVKDRDRENKTTRK